METTPISFHLVNFRPVESRLIFAIGDAVLEMCGISVTLHGITCRNLPGGGTSVHLPQSRNERGEWVCAISLPVEPQDALADQILDHLLETGIARSRYQPAMV